ncbi:DoxX family protein, partial [Streptomyces triticagri]|uniref:DoxX family protein n=1 Tax=Streptomyces triticagri TaxID=2293568 RepID=UPI001F21495A
MSVDTRTPRTPTGGRSPGFDEGPPLSMAKVPCDPAQVVVNHASFRVQLPAAQRAQSPRITRHFASAGAAAATSVIPVAGAAGAVRRRRAPVVWSGRSAPGDPGATGLLQAVRGSGVRHGDEAGAPLDTFEGGAATQVIPRVGVADPAYGDTESTVETPHVVGPRHPGTDETVLLPSVGRGGGAGELGGDTGAFTAYGDDHAYDLGRDFDGDDDRRTGRRRSGGDPVRHAYYPGRRMNLGVVLLPLRIFLGFISIYAGMGKLCDPVYFDGGDRGSMVKWLTSLHPWALAEPLRDFALQHPVGAGLFIAFLQVGVGVLTVLGLWQRFAAGIGALLSAALLVTVSWRSVPVYDAPDMLYLAAWSPLIIAGAPVYSVDARLAGEAWRTLGPRADIWDLRRRVLRRGALIAAVLVGLTLLVGALLGGAVRDADRVRVPGPGETPRNELPGSPLPKKPGERRDERRTPSSTGSPGQGGAAGPSARPTQPGTAPESAPAGTTGQQPSQPQGTTGQAPPQEQPAAPPPDPGG